MRQRWSVPGAVLAAVALTVPLPVAASAPDVAGAFTVAATAIPIQLVPHDQSLPVAVELDLGYTHAEAVSGPDAHGRASWLWPGDAVGTGLKQIRDNSGLPIPEQLTARGYPIQVNSGEPATGSTRTSQSDEPAPGMVMRTEAGDHQTLAQAGWSADGEVSPSDAPAPRGGRGGGGGGGLPGLPPLPGLAGTVSSAPSPGPTSAPPAPGDSPLGRLAGLVDAATVSSVSRVSYGGPAVTSYAGTRIGDLSLAGGLVTADAVNVVTTSTSTLQHARTTQLVRIVGLQVAGHPFTVGKDGVEADGQGSGPIPGLPGDATAALAQLGLSFELPPGQRKVSGTTSSMASQGLHVVVDLRKLHHYLDQVPVDDILGQLPPQTQDLTKWIGAAAHLSPLIDIYLGSASTSAVALKPPDLCLGCSPTPAAPAAPGVPPVGGVSGTVPPVAPLPPPGAPLPPPAGPATVPAGTVPVSAGLPPLAGVPGLIMGGALLLAAGLGWGARRAGLLALGGAAACGHGLETGLPDLRKA
jgi:hypothetical protein